MVMQMNFDTSSKTEHPFLDLKTILKLLIKKKNFIIIISLSVLVISMLSISFKPTYYQSKILLKIQNAQQSYLSNTNSNGLDVNSTRLQEPISVQIALLKSDFILKSVIDALGLNITITPHNKFLKDNNQLSFHDLTVSSKLLNKKLELVVVDDHRYQLYNSKGKLLFEGKTGENTIDQHHSIGLMIDTINALPGSRFTLIKKSDYAIINQIRSNLSITNLNGTEDNNENAVALIQLSLTGKNPQSVLDMLNKIASIIQEKNINLKYQQTDKSLSFLNHELPILQESLQQAEQKLNTYRATSGRINVELQTEYLINHLSNLDKELENIRVKKTNLLQQYTLHHPLIIALSDEQDELENERQKLLKQLRELPASNQEDVDLMRDVKIKNDLYIQLLNQIHELEVNKAGIVSDIQILSPATLPETLPSVRKSLVAIISFLTGLFIASCAFLFWNILSGKIFQLRVSTNF
jgi:tyrosine-protein kinase Etk/Wzc